MYAVTYARVSTDEQVEGYSIPVQVEAARKKAQEEGYTVLEELVDQGHSGATLDRPAVSRLRELTASRGIQAVVIHDPDRLSRKLSHLMILTEELRGQGVEVIFVNAPKDDTPEGRMLFGLKGLFAEYEREKMRQRTMQGKKRRAEAGYVLGGRIPYGYEYVSEDHKGHYVIDEDEAKVVEMMFNWLVEEGKSTREIAWRLTIMQVPRKQGGRQWDTSTVHRILRNETYTGVTYYNKHKSAIPPKHRTNREGKSKVTSVIQRPRDEWIAIPVPKIISKELFEAAGRQLRANSRNCQRNAKLKYLLRGRIKCGLCGRALWGTPFHGKPYFRCSGKDRNVYITPDRRCTAGSVRALKIEKVVWEQIERFLQDPQLIIRELKARRKRAIEEGQRKGNELEIVESALSKAEQEEDRLIELYKNDVIDMARLKSEIDKVRREKEELEARRKEIHLRTEAQRLRQFDLEAVEEYLALVRKNLKRLTFKKKRRILELLDIEVIVTGKRVELRGILTVPEVGTAPITSWCYVCNLRLPFEVELELHARGSKGRHWRSHSWLLFHKSGEENALRNSPS